MFIKYENDSYFKSYPFKEWYFSTATANPYGLLNLKFNIAEETQKDALEIFQNTIEKQEKILDKISLFAACLFYCIQRQNNSTPISIQDYCKILQEQNLKVIPRVILRDMLKFNNYIKKK